MPTSIKFRGGTATEHQSFTGAEREITIDTTNNTVVVHDGSTVGGFPLALADLTNATGGIPSDATVTSGATTPGSCSTEGALFYNTTDGSLYVCQSGSYVQSEAPAAGISYGATTPASCALDGQLFFNSAEEKLYICNGSTYDAATPNLSDVVASGATTPASCTVTGKLFYNTAEENLYTCDGSVYVSATNATTATGTSTPGSCSIEGGFFFNSTEQKLYICSGGSYTLAVPTSAQIQAGSLTVAAFASSIRPIEIFATNPTTGNTEGRLVYNTTDDKLYRYDGTAFTSGWDAGDLTGTLSADRIGANSITAGKIQAGAIGTTELAADAVNADKLAANSVLADNITSNAVTSDKIIANAITSGKISAGAVDADKIATNAVTADKVSAGAITAAKIQAGAVEATKIAASAVTTDKIAAGAVNASKIAAASITADKIAASEATISGTGNFAFGDGATIGGYSGVVVGEGAATGVAGGLFAGGTTGFGMAAGTRDSGNTYSAGIFVNNSNADYSGTHNTYVNLGLYDKGIETSGPVYVGGNSAINTSGVAQFASYRYSTLTSTNQDFYIEFVNSTNSAYFYGFKDSDFRYNPSTNVVTVGGTATPFTGAHEGLIASSESIEQGDIVVDSEIIAKKSVSNVLTLVTKATSANQKSAIGVFNATTDSIPVAIATKQTVIREANEGELPKVVTGYEDEFNTKPVVANDTVEDIVRVVDPQYADAVVDRDYCLFNAVGEGMVNVCGENGDIAVGDLIVTSNTAGKGMKQADDIVRSYTVAKAREAVTFSNASEVKQVACIYLCG